MSDDEMEKFEITDYDLDNEFNIHRSRKGLSKHQQIYGIWADDSDNEEDDGRNSYKSKKPKGYTAPIGFVAGGVQQAGKKDKDNKKEVKMETEESDDEKPTTSFKSRDSSDESDTEVPRAGFGSNSKSKLYQTQSTVTEVNSDIAGMRKKSTLNKSLINQGVGNWEKHTKGIGAKLLLQMGFQPGKGLGKDLQGISAPVEAHLRKGRGAIGAYGPEKPATVPSKIKKNENQVKIEIEEEEEELRESKWKKGDFIKKKTRYYYRSVDDVIERGKKSAFPKNFGINSELSKVKVIDMTGPQQRVLSGYHALSGLKAPPGVEHFEDVLHKKCSNFALPEIQHNLDILVDICEQEIIQIDRSTRYNTDKITALKQEEIDLNDQLQREDDLLSNLTYVTRTVDQLMDPTQGFSLNQFAMMFAELRERHADEFTRYRLAELAPGLVGPLLTSALAGWGAQSEHKRFVDVFAKWRRLLDDADATIEGNKQGVQPFDTLVWRTWVPAVRECVSTWKPRDCDPMITLIDEWKPILSPWILVNIYDQLIIPKILAEVKAWNPMVDTIPIHIWIHPWIPLLDDRLQEKIYPIIQEKLGTALTNWHPSDKSAKLMLAPWQGALNKGAFLAFLLKHIVPKLQLCMQNLVVNPHQQHLDLWNWVMDWNDMVSVPNMTLILDKFFFPKWLQALALWLNHNPNYNQVTEWYSGWKRMLSEELLMQPTIKESFHKALGMMSRAVGMGQQPGARESISYLTNIEMNGNVPPPPPPRIENFAEAVRTSAQIPQGFKDLVTKRCEERGILFVPITNKYHEAKQVYRIGSNGVQCYIDRNVIFYSQNNSTWTPTSLNKLLDIS